MRARDLMNKVRAGEPVDDAEFGAARLTDETFEIDDEVMVGKTVRVPMADIDSIETLATQQGTTYSKKIRQWIEEGLAREMRSAQDPAAALASAVAHLNTAAERAQQLLEQQRRAA